MKVRLSEKADADLLRIYSYAASRNPTAARGIVEAIHKKLDILSHFPFAGQSRPHLGPAIRGFVSGNLVILYVAEGEDITVVRIIDGRMDVDEEFRR